jgi:hypothetical protein
MSITIVAEVWRALKQEIDEANLPDAAESLINILVDNDYENAEIKEAFRRDNYVIQALREFNEQYQDDEEEIEDEEEEYEDYDDEDY